MTRIQHRLSLVIPLYNEAENIAPLLAEIHQALAHCPWAWEAILVDDGSTDDTVKNLYQGVETYGTHIRPIILQRNFGQTAAMQAGIDSARGSIIVTLDGDLQNDPADIPRLVEQLITEDLDLLVGWRKNRQDAMINRKLPSRIANRLIGKVTGVHLHDYGCSLKVYRASVIKQVRLYGEMHRFIPVWVSLYTSPARIKEAVVNHRARQFGQSKYGIGRTFRVIPDLLAVYFFQHFLSRPGHFFGKMGLAAGSMGSVILVYLAILKLFTGADIGARPLLIFGVLLVIAGVQFLSVGVLAEMLSRTYFSTGKNASYLIRQTTTLDDAEWHTAK